MVRGRAELGLLALGITLALLQVYRSQLAGVIAPPTPAPTSSQTPTVSRDVSVIWREFRPGQRQDGPSTRNVQLCGAALERGSGRSALVLRFCNSQPTTPQRRFAFGYDDLRVRAQLPGGVRLAWDLLDFTPTQNGGASFTQGALPDNQVPVARVSVEDLTDIVFVLGREFPVGLPTIEISGRYAGSDTHEIDEFGALGPDLESTEAARVATAPDWTRARY